MTIYTVGTLAEDFATLDGWYYEPPGTVTLVSDGVELTSSGPYTQLYPMDSATYEYPQYTFAVGSWLQWQWSAPSTYPNNIFVTVDGFTGDINGADPVDQVASIFFGVTNGATYQASVQEYSPWDYRDHSGVAFPADHPQYFRLARPGLTTWSFQASPDGTSWTEIAQDSLGDIGAATIRVTCVQGTLHVSSLSGDDGVPPEPLPPIIVQVEPGTLDFTGQASADVPPTVQPAPATETALSSAAGFSEGLIDIYDLSAIELRLSGALDVGYGPGFAVWILGELATVSDFAFFTATEPDPAMAIAVDDNNGTVTGAGSAWTRHFMTLYGPTENNAWKRAAFAAVGLVYKAMPAGGIQWLDDVQWEIAPVQESVPQPYRPARSLDLWVEPTRLNHATNPSFEVDTTDWYTTGSATITRITTDAVVGDACLQATGLFAIAGSAVAHKIRTLTPGRVYTASVYLRSMDGADVGLDVSVGGWGSPRTWLTAEPLTDKPEWRRLQITFTATSTAAIVYVRSLGLNDSFLLDGLLVEEGNGLKDYFDGDSGLPDYVWELDGTAGLSRSYYYRDKLNRHYILGKTLNENVQLGLVVGDPVYADSASTTTTPYGSGYFGSGPYGG